MKMNSVMSSPVVLEIFSQYDMSGRKHDCIGYCKYSLFCHVHYHRSIGQWLSWIDHQPCVFMSALNAIEQNPVTRMP